MTDWLDRIFPGDSDTDPEEVERILAAIQANARQDPVMWAERMAYTPPEEAP